MEKNKSITKKLVYVVLAMVLELSMAHMLLSKQSSFPSRGYFGCL